MKYFWLVILLLCVTVQAQIQTKSVYDFSGGLVNSLSNSLMQDNQATRFEDVIVTDIGSLKARPGYRLAHTDTLTGRESEGLFFFRGRKGSRFLYRLQNRDWIASPTAKGDTLSDWSLRLSRCNDYTMSCLNGLTYTFYSPIRQTRTPATFTTAYLPVGEVLAATKSEPLLLLNDSTVAPLRPRHGAQPSVLALDGGGKLTGRFRYAYTFIDTVGTKDTGWYGPFSQWVDVKSGKVAIFDFRTRYTDTGQHRIVIFRASYDDDTSITNLYLKVLDTMHYGDSVYIDTLPATASLASRNPIGVWHGTIGPVGLNAVLDTLGGTPTLSSSFWIKRFNGTGFLNVNYTVQLWYKVVFIDSSGRSTWSGQAPNSSLLNAEPHWDITFDGDPVENNPDTVGNSTIYLRLPPAPPNTAHVYLYRKAHMVQTSGSPARDTTWDWHLVRDLIAINYQSGTIKDTLPLVKDSISAYDGRMDHLNTDPPDDSLLTFRPSAAVAFNSRVFYVGDERNPNYVYYSDFGRPGCVPPDHIISVVSNTGDWLNGLYSFGDRLLLFRHNSIFQFVGASFYQFQLDEIANNVGLSGPRTLAGSQNEVFFAHQTGIYEIPRGGAISNEPISLPIQNSFDSTASSELTANGVVIGRDYWYSPAPTVYPKTYIYTALPRPHWKVYTIGIKSATLYDPDTNAVDFASRKYILLNNYNHLLRWDYADTSDFDAAGLQGETAISPLYQSKYFFEGPTRTMIQYVDVEATGAMSTMTVSLICNYRDTIVSKTVIDPDFRTESKVRVKFGRIVKNAAVRLEWEGSTAVIKGYTIGYTPWDGGKL